MNIGFLLPTLFASAKLFPDRIFAPRQLAVDTINGLVKNGHTVSVFSTNDFLTQGTLIAGDSTPYANRLRYHKLGRVNEKEAEIRNDEVWKRTFEIEVTTRAYGYALKHGLDLIHSYHDFLFTPHYLEEATGVPTVYTLHDPLPPEGSFEYHQFQKFSHHRYISISDSQRVSTLPLRFAATVLHGLDTSSFPFNPVEHGYLLFMGRLTREKGLHTAIQTAIATGVPLEIGTNFPNEFHGDEYFEKEIKPFIDHPLIHEPGMAKGDKKMLLYKDARALLFPIEWEEPFGMVMIEAMACGTPVIAFNRGSVPEIVKDGVSGFIVNPEKNSQDTDTGSQNPPWIIQQHGVEGLIEAVRRIGEIDRSKCRQYVEEHFSQERMVRDYETAYRSVLS